MTPFEHFLASQPTIASLRGFDRQAAVAAGIRPTVASDWELLHGVFYGRTKWTAQQRTAREKAIAAGHDLERLLYIERRLKTVADVGTRWSLRHMLLDVRGSYARLKSEADAIIPKAEPKAPERGVRFTGSRQGMRGIAITATERLAADLEHRLRLGVDPNAPEAPQLYDALVDILTDTSSGVAPAAPTPLVLAPLEEHTKILSGTGDETVLQLTDGTTMTGAEYLGLLGGEIGVALFHPLEGAVNCYRGARFANGKQRILAKAMSPGCAVPDCRRAAEDCEVHHIEAWSQGGETNIANLIPLCTYHNRVNDDVRERARRGHVVYIDGRPVWISPRGYPVPARVPGAMELLFGPLSKARRTIRAPGTSTSS